MLKHRVIPSLLIHDGGLVKTRQFRKPVYVGDPINAIRIFNEKEVDELIVLDIDASRNQSEPNYRLIEQIASECFMPVCYGGGVKNVQQARQLLSLGIEKVAVQSAAMDDIKTISSIADFAGSSSVVASIDVKSDWRGRRGLYASKSRKIVSESWEEFLTRAIGAGAGEILLMNVDREGMMAGVDTELIALAARITSVPLVVSGGVGSITHIADAVKAGADAVAVGAFCVFQGPHRAVLITYPAYDELVKVTEK
ncbi:MAG: imidazole glycerol phosphate synthase subunit HisF [Acidimicrobiaceae bacterium]|nr:imidazole glycerol phosphate synthase subunit HisF [Acidimicrobiaceae bacterium]